MANREQAKKVRKVSNSGRYKSRHLRQVLWYGPAFVRRVTRLRFRLLIGAFCCIFCSIVGPASGAGTHSIHRQQAAELRRENATLSQRIQGATLDLYALDSKLRQVQAQLSSLNTQRAEIARERQSVRRQLAVTQQNVHRAQRHVAILVHTLYEQQSNDALAVVLDARSLDEAIAGLDELGRSARANEQVAARSRDAQRALGALASKLAQQDARMRALQDAAARTAASLAGADQTRRQYLAALANQRRLNDGEIAAIEAQAQASATAAASAPPASLPVQTTTGTGTLAVTATGYAMGGTTAAGLPVGWGTVAVDPSVIPLGTRLTIPGYGQGVAADTGAAVQGAAIDLWFPTVREARAWGRRVITITLD
jgi:3D (Asp-Asp-Asp) domain-containing protein/DNA repair exonuclease SbcCD ATPase subunit